MKNLVSTNWLNLNIEKVRILDASWHMPNTNRDAFKEFKLGHIKNAIFFDLDKSSNQNATIPHMLPDKDCWSESISNFGIKNSDHIVIYDNSDVISSCRAWYNFLYFNHNPNLVSVLDGGLKKWIKEGKEISKKIRKFPTSNYFTKENFQMVLNKNQIDSNIKNKNFELVDARSESRFNGSQPEPRKELRSGNIEGSKNIPFMKLINDEDKTFKEVDDIMEIFKKLDLDPKKDIVFTCGSGVTACILGLANSIITGKNPFIYDGSWSEYGLKLLK